MKRVVSGIMLAFLITSMLISTFNIKKVKSSPGVLFFDDFTDGIAEGWTEYCEEQGTWSVINGEYFVTVEIVENGISTVNELNLTDCIIETKLRFGDTEVGYRAGIIFRYNDNQHYYSFEIGNEYDEIDIIKYSVANPEYGESRAVVAPEYGNSSIIINANIDYTLRIEVHGNSFTAYLNGQEVLSWTEETYTSGKVGLRARRADVFFDNFTLISVPKTITVPDDYSTIQEAINNANDEDIVYVRTGTYCENIVLNKTISLSGENKTTTIIDGGRRLAVNIIANRGNMSGFTIRNSISAIENRGIYGEGLTGNNISYNIVTTSLLGIGLRYSFDCYISNNDVYGNAWGIQLWECSNCFIDNNNAHDNYNTHFSFSSGIEIVGSTNCHASGNNLTSNQYGFYLPNCSNCFFYGNNIENNWVGMELYGSNNIFRNNSISRNVYDFGIIYTAYLEYYIQDIDASNMINGKPLYYLTNQNNLAIDSVTYPDIGYLAIVNSDNVTVEDLIITNNVEGILFANVTNSNIRNVTVSNNEWCGVELVSCFNCCVSSSNTNYNEGYGIRIHSTYSSDSFDCAVRNNEVESNGISGIELSNVRNCSITSNIIDNPYGIRLWRSDYCHIIKNKINSRWNGINILNCSSCSIIGNTICNNEQYAISFEDELQGRCQNNIICHNNFINNKRQVRIGGAYNTTWDDGYPSGGNYWSDYNGTDLYCGPYQNETGSDGMGDIPYIVDTDNIDHYPFTSPWHPRDIDVSNVNTSKSGCLPMPTVGQNQNVSISVYIENKGSYYETINVTVYMDTTEIKRFISANISSNNFAAFVFVWNSSGFSVGNHTISAIAIAVSNESDLTNNVFTDCWIVITLPGDVDGDFDVDIYDVVKITDIYGFKVGDPDFSPNSDLDDDGEIMIYDVVRCTSHYGQTYP